MDIAKSQRFLDNYFSKQAKCGKLGHPKAEEKGIYSSETETWVWMVCPDCKKGFRRPLTPEKK